MSGKKLLNTVEKCVDENLEGLVTINPGLRLIKDSRVVVRADIESVKTAGKVALLCGGGSGHEPAHAGYVGSGMLSCAVAGSVFTSPPPQDILTGLRMITKNNPGGCLVMVPNYTGDRLNFGIGMERGKHEGLKISAVTIGEDCATSSQDKSAGRRGLCGMFLLIKIAGALAEEGKSLDEVTKLSQQAIDNMGTIGLALGACSTPGSSGPLFTVQSDEMELGLGLHGEAGVKRIKLMTSKETVKVMIDHMRNPENSTHLPIKTGDRVACMINNLGGMSVLEMNVIAKDTIQYLEGDLGLKVDRAYCSTYVTSLEMAGISISLLHLNDTFTRCLDAPTTAPAWLVPLLGPGQTDRQTPEPMTPIGGPNAEGQQIKGASISKDEGDRIYDMILKACERLEAAKEMLDGLDSESGDGDCGSTMSRGAQCIREKLGKKENPGLSVTNPFQLSLELASIVESVMGGSSGGIYSLFFTAASSQLQKEVTVQSWLQSMVAGIAAIQRYGGAEPGDRTMLDALWAAKETFQGKLADMSPVEAFKEAVKAGESAAENTKSLKARAGRASYVSADLLTKPDPGAMAVAVWLRAIQDTLN
ncbi:triokinase/FMN cyclase-like isoform X2 [Ruditapes philippinarum]|uniref:triokinase/FMN cyclase-like isoform X2 n=1 Tax=Ruditapes philippinarum TaxID=129788 RepID=UPI00295BD068|nr:triokinase/FMN cyclase-like isoform X2 [Ruditapes philippinarum]